MKKYLSLILSITLLITSYAHFNSVYAVQSDTNKITPQLQAAIDENLSETYDVAIWITDTDLSDVKQSAAEAVGMDTQKWEKALQDKSVEAETVHKYKQKHREKASQKYDKHNKGIVSNIMKKDEIVYISQYAPMIIAKLSEKRIQKIAKDKNVIFIDLYINDTQPCTISGEEVAKITTVINEEDMGYTGSDVRIGIMDTGIPNSNPSSGELPFYSNVIACNGTYNDDHAGICGSIIMNIAPDAEYYFCGGDIDLLYGLEWLISNGVDIISMSMECGSVYNSYTALSRWFDHISYQHAIIIVTPSGNHASSGVKEAQMAYNVLTVGALNHMDSPSYDDDVIQSASAYYNGTTYAYKPDICAPYDYTSTATACTSGMIALLLEADPTLSAYPEAIKAILTASVNKTSHHKYLPSERNLSPSIPSYLRYGAGMIDAYLAASNVLNNKYQSNVMLTSETYDTIQINVTRINSPLRISLAFLQPALIDPDIDNHENSNAVASYSPCNLDLYVYLPNSNVPYVQSCTLTNNVEIVEFTPPQTGTYQIKIVQTSPSSQSIYYSVAWSN